ncbi:MAG TPA: methyltransferase domain-containing protein [Candidatus Didemnitutus sp.]
MSAPPPEFDRFAPNYDAGFDASMKAWIGADARAFLRPKLALLRRVVAARREPPAPELDYLDFGCGAGDFLALVNEANLPWRGEGCDVSGGMLEEARRRHPGLTAKARLWPIETNTFPEGRYDLITAICVFHHIPPAEWADTFARLGRALRPGGLFCLIEHNPWNPVTAWMVSRTAIDADAHLLSPAVSRRTMRAAGFGQIRTQQFLFVPPRGTFTDALDRTFSWLPLGGQYLMSGTAPEKTHCAGRPAPVT